MPTPTRRLLTIAPLLAGVCGLAVSPVLGETEDGTPRNAPSLQFTYLWHLEQPIYWPTRQRIGATDRYETAWTSIQMKNSGAANPLNNLTEIFGLDDRRYVYQTRVRDSIDAIRWHPFAGAQVSYSGGLIKNVQSLGAANQLGYSNAWNQPKQQARGWRTAGNQPRLDIVLFPFHHPLSPLVSDSTLRKEIQIYKAVYQQVWGNSAPMSRGFFPSEMAFSTRMIPVLEEEGIDWVFVSSEKISRATPDYPVVLGSGGMNCDPPNRADQVNPPGNVFYRKYIDRGVSPAEAVPLSYTPAYAQGVNPSTGQIHRVIVIPCSQSLGWDDGYSPMGTGQFATIQSLAGPVARPMLITLAHDGDNAWGGGYSYYMQATPDLVATAHAQGYRPTVVEQYLADHPVPIDAVVHVEDGAWVNADSDFGSPQFWNWNWPPLNAQGQIDVENGWHADIRNWAVITAAQSYVDTAEQIHQTLGGTINPIRIVYPEQGANAAERAWHYFLGSLNSGYMYYGTSIDMEVKPTVACNEAIRLALPLITTNPTLDNTGPAVWLPQRQPWNPGSLNFGAPYGYQPYINNGDFHIWTFAYDTSGVQSVTLKYRIDLDGVNPLDCIQNETYAGGPDVGPWESVAMTQRVFPAGNVYNDPEIDFFVMPDAIADQYYAKLVGLRDVLIDYYVEAVDTRGNITRSAIQHVYIGDGSGSQGPGGPGGSVVTASPEPLIAGELATITYNPSGRPLQGAAQVFAHVGFNGWNDVLSPDVAMSFDAVESRWTMTIPLPVSAEQINLAFNNGSGTWDNNSGMDWAFTVVGGAPADTWTIDGQLDADAVLLATNNGVPLYAGLKGDVLYLATAPAQGSSRDRFVFLAQAPGAMQAAPWAKAGQVAAWSAFIGNEESNGWSGWFNANAPAQVAQGSVLEGTINLRAQFGIAPGEPLPTTVYAAVGSYMSPDGGALDPSRQTPPSLDNDGNIQANEYLAIDLCSIGLACCPADLTGPAFDGVPDGVVNAFDLNYYITLWIAQNPDADLTGPALDGVPDGAINAFDLNYYIALWLDGAGACN